MHAMSVIRVDDAADPRLADFTRLREPAHRERVEAAAGYFVAESPRVIRRVIESGRQLRAVLVTEAQHAALASDLTAVDAPVYVAPVDVLREVVGFDLHRGAVASVARWPLPPVEDVLAHARRVAVCERLNDHENLGVLFRSAGALGIDAVLLDAACADPLYRRCVRVSIGHACTVPWTRLDDLGALRAAGFTTVALTPAPDACDMRSFDWPAHTALLLGAEGPGLSEAWLHGADARVRIPMHDGADSLNVATAAAIAFYASSELSG
jgi:tRNA G18 (ribose-2'-O)-methylase SpoU